MRQAVFDEFHEVIIGVVEQDKTKKFVKMDDDDNDEGNAAVLDHSTADSGSNTADMAAEQPLADKEPRTYREITRKAYLSLVKP
ncbi:hypothetical protein [Nitrosomonas aestuarii]|uniref:hypothetical protein n=1 Tax=Nitrosomonas aestuarii TaxID=52441 RepID=UPI000D429E04|nr:hypothetical protein [Nitrosomonas aestuarii]PTN08422.1 hypothetical protein C8R11_1281 [Nitrosomonas aestuarii]